MPYLVTAKQNPNSELQIWIVDSDKKAVAMLNSLQKEGYSLAKFERFKSTKNLKTKFR